MAKLTFRRDPAANFPSMTSDSPAAPAANFLRNIIEADLAAGRWVVGERLPGERALADELGVSRPSVREALREIGRAHV